MRQIAKRTGASLATRLTLWMVGVTSLSVAVVWFAADRGIRTSLQPMEVRQGAQDARALLAPLEDAVHAAGKDVLVAANAVDVREAMSLSEEARTRGQTQVARVFAALLAAKPQYLQVRLIGAANRGREIVRLERAAVGGPIQQIADVDLQTKGDRDYFRAGMRAGAGEVHVTSIELNRERGTIQQPHVPVLRVVTPIAGDSGEAIGVVVINVDLRDALAGIRRGAAHGGQVYLLDDAGHFLVHPDPAREFEFELGSDTTFADDFPNARELVGVATPTASIANVAGRDTIVAAAPETLAGGTRVIAVTVFPSLSGTTSFRVRRGTLLVAACVAVLAIVLASVVARSITRPLVQTTEAAARLMDEEPPSMPTNASGETGVLARTLAHMDRTLRQARADGDLLIRQLQRSNSELEQFAYVASHDLKAPLRDIANLADWVVKDLGSVPAATAEDLATMRQRVRRMETLLNDLLAYSRAGRTGAKSERFTVQEALASVQAFLPTRHGIAVDLQRDPEVPLHTPRAPLETVLRNLLSNAIKHHTGESGHVSLQFERDGDERIVFRVEDDGPGIPVEYQERVFAMFQTLRPKDEVEGSGMGLAMAKKVVESYGGEMTLKSAEGRGSTFSFTWPLTWTE